MKVELLEASARLVSHSTHLKLGGFGVASALGVSEALAVGLRRFSVAV